MSKPPRIRLGMVGGGQGAFIGGVHRIAARIDDHYDLVAGALSSSPDRAAASARDLGLAPDRSYGDFEQMARREASLADGIEAVSIVTPNHMHFAAARTFLEAGIHVICDKPVTATLEEARALAEIADRTRALFVLTHNYTGYPMVRKARQMATSGRLGALRLVQVEYPQDWLTEPLEQTGQKQAAWRTDPAKSGAGGCIGDIGTHALNLAEFITGRALTGVCADIDTFVEGRVLDDNVHVMLRFEDGVKGLLWASQVAPGNENALRIRVYGAKGGLEWAQEDPNRLAYTPFGAPAQTITRAGPDAGEAAARMSRLPPGHPEGYLEGFANIYSEAAAAIYARRDGQPLPADVTFPTVADGVRGLEFIAAALASSAADGAWIDPRGFQTQSPEPPEPSEPPAEPTARTGAQARLPWATGAP